ncbi:MAG: hypothetical protein WAK83_01670 [Trebonia sp.]|uniref:hypothetical protein n=1 Tax=Trebonia sp. TaxID=2767075 RepID=UPI003BAFCAAE
MIQAQATAARIACTRMTVPHLTELHDSVERACGLTGRFQWGRKTAAHAEIVSLPAGMVDDPLLAPLLSGGTAHARELMLAVGHAADGIIVSSLLYMRRLALPGRPAVASEAAI